MTALTELTIEAFESGDIRSESFDHENHVYAGWLYLQQYDQRQAITRFSAALRRLTDKFGVPDKYHETITWFFLLLIAERQDPNKDESFQSFKTRNPDLFTTNPSVINRYYSKQRLAAPLARNCFLLPDKLAAEAFAAN